MALAIEPLDWPGDADTVVSFLTSHEWPFHAVSRLSSEAAAAVRVAADDIASFWIRERDEVVGLIRVWPVRQLLGADRSALSRRRSEPPTH